ncbi:MAG: murD [Clostridiaceae bacterium]|jgi:UDP-N-acetylmuramoylalanine--D-glutamate ligase|nr:murD [Clostridiaceae bacterium]
MNKSFDQFKEFIRGKNTAVVGIGISNIPLINYLVSLGAHVTAFDKKSFEQLGQTAEEFENKGVRLVLGPDYLNKLTGYQVIFKTPSMRIDSEEFANAKREGAYITSEMEEFVKYCPAKLYGVTGSDGKTTTTTIISKMLKQQGYKTWVGGNIGNPLFSQIEEINENDRVVLELSSFQLMTMDASPEVSVVTNLSPNHLDMHKSMEEYINAKKNIYKYQQKENLLILNEDNNITNNMEADSKGKVMKFSRNKIVENGAYYKDGVLYLLNKEICKYEDIVLKGMHNVENYLAAFCAVSDDVSIENMKEVALSFNGVEHRNEFVRELNGVKYYNDSIGTSPTRTIATISVYDKPVILIAGGYDKHIPFEPLAEKGYENIKILILLGLTKDKIKAAFDKLKESKNIEVPIIIVNSLEEAVLKAKSLAVDGDTVILSPACASFDMFPNFEARGNRFKSIVNDL